MKIRALLSLIAGGLAAFFLPREQARGTFAPMDQGHVAWLMANRPQGAALTAKANVIFARLDDFDHPESERQFEAWPPTALEWSGLLDELATLEPRTIALSGATAWATQAPEPLLDKSCAALPGLILGTRGEAQGAVQVSSLPALSKISGDVSAVPQFSLVTGEVRLSPLGKLALSQVDLSEHPQAKPTLADGVLRFPMLFRQGDRVMPSLLLQALAYQAKVPMEQMEVRLGEMIKLPGLPDIPIDAAGGFSLQLTPINEQPLPSFNLDTLKMDAAQRERFLAKDDPVRSLLPKLKDALIWIGEDHRDARRYALPDGRNVSLSELSARALIALQTGRNVVPQPLWGQFVVLGGVLIYGLWLARLSRSRLWKWTLLGVILLGLASLLTFQTNGQWMPVGSGLVTLGILWLVNLVVPQEKVA